MEKLISLINEYEQLNMCRKFDSFEMHTFENSNGVDRLLEDTVISHRYGFIKRLLDNNKINYLTIKSVFKYYYLDVVAYSDYESTLMLLAISDNPIEDLCGYLKDEATEKVDKLLDGAKRTCENIGI